MLIINYLNKLFTVNNFSAFLFGDSNFRPNRQKGTITEGKYIGQ